jgi:hypothetical protein
MNSLKKLINQTNLPLHQRFVHCTSSSAFCAAMWSNVPIKSILTVRRKYPPELVEELTAEAQCTPDVDDTSVMQS